MRKKSILILSIALACMMFIGCGKTTSTAGDEVEEVVVDTTNTTLLEFKDEAYGLTLSVPNTWIKSDMAPAKFGYLIGEDNSGVNLVSESAQGYKLDKYAEVSFNMVQELFKVTDLKRESKKIAKHDAETATYTLETQGVVVKVYQVCFIENDTAIIFTLNSTTESYDKNIKEFEDTLKTLKFL